MAAVADEVIHHALSLASRHATYSARAEFLAALRIIAEALDLTSGTTQHTNSLDAALVALREADDFAAAPADVSVDVRLIVRAHKTPVLKDEELTARSPLAARQHYYTFAQNKLAEAFSNDPIASRALYGLGKLYTERTRRVGDARMISAPKAVVFHRAAMIVHPQNHLAANELAVLLAQFGDLKTAKEVLLHALKVTPTPEAWHNLAVVHQRLGQHDLARRAQYEQQLLVSRTADNLAPAADAADGPVRWVDPETFAQMNPEPFAPPRDLPRQATSGGAKETASPWWRFWK